MTEVTGATFAKLVWSEAGVDRPGSDAMTHAAPAFGAPLPLPLPATPALPVAGSRHAPARRTPARKRPRCALPGAADAADGASAPRVAGAAAAGREARAKREERVAARARAREAEAALRAKAATAKAREREAAVSAKAKAREAEKKEKEADKREKEAASAAKLKAKGTEKKEKEKEADAASAAKLKAKEVEKAKKEVAAAEKKDSEATVQLPNSASGKKRVESLRSSAEPAASPQSPPSPKPSPSGTENGKPGATTKGDGEMEFFVASQDSPNVSSPSNEVADDTSVVGRPQAQTGRPAVPQYSADAAGEATSPLSADDPAISAMHNSDAAGADAVASSLTPPSAKTPSLSPESAVNIPDASVGVITDVEPRAETVTGPAKGGEEVVGQGKEKLVSPESTRAEPRPGQPTPRAFSLTRVKRLGASTRREFSRAVLDSNLMNQFRMPSRRDVARFAWDGMLVVTLVLLLQTGVSRTLRWVHNRFDSSRGASKPSFPYELSVFECLQRPLEFVSIFTVGTALAEAVSRPLAAAGLVRYIRTLRELGVIIAATWFLLRWIDRIRLRFAVDKRIDKAQVDATSRVATVVTTVIAILISLDTVGVNVQTVLAFGGIGGVAIGFAGREIISNFFSGFMIFLTRPFSVGEWIRSIEEKELNGTVEDIGWYLTRVRTWDKRPLYIPNSRFSTLIVENPSRMSNRRILHTLHLRLEDMPVVKEVVSGIDALLKEHPDLDPKQHRLAYVDSFDEFSVKVWMSCYTKSVFLFDWRRVQQELLLAAYGIVREHGARLATTTTRDVRRGSDPDRYGPLGESASYRNRRDQADADKSFDRIATGEDHLDRPTLPSIMADIESGLITDEELSTAAAAAAAQGNGAPVTAGSQRTDASSFKSNLNSVSGSNASRASPVSASPLGNKGEDGGSGSTVDNAPTAGSDSEKFLRNTGLSPSRAEAFEIAVAAILAARKNQQRSDGRSTADVSKRRTQVQPNSGPSPVVGPSSPVGGANGYAKPDTSANPVAAVSGGSGGSGSSSDETPPAPPAGQMKIFGAPRAGSSSSAKPASSSGPSTPGSTSSGVAVGDIESSSPAAKPNAGSSSTGQVQREMNISAAPKRSSTPPSSSAKANASPAPGANSKVDSQAEKKRKRKKGE